MKLRSILLATMLVSTSVFASEYKCIISQPRYEASAELQSIFASGKIEVSVESKALLADVTKNEISKEKVRVALEMGPSFDKSKLYVHFYAIDTKGSADPADFSMVFDNHTEIDLDTKSISMRSSGNTEELLPISFSCKLEQSKK